MKPGITIRHKLRPGDIGYLTYLHGILYARAQGWDHTFEAYVAGPLADFAKLSNSRERIWIGESEGGDCLRSLSCLRRKLTIDPSDLAAAGRLYRSFGFEKTEEMIHELWGKMVPEERYDLSLTAN